MFKNIKYYQRVILLGFAWLCLGAMPQQVLAEYNKYKQISAGYENTCGLKVDGSVICWGYNGYGRNTAPSGIFTQISVGWGWGHTCGLKNDGSATCWGAISNEAVNSSSGSSYNLLGTFTQIAAGGNAIAVLKNDGSAIIGYSFQWVDSGRWDNVGGILSGPFTQFSVGAHICGLKNDGSAACLEGENYTQKTVLSGPFTQLSSGYYHTCGLKSDGSAVCWGAGKTNTGTDFEYGQSIVPSGTFIQISAGGLHTCGLKSDGSAVCWGKNDYGQNIVPSGTFIQISAGGLHTCGLKSDGSAVCWGKNDYGETNVPVEKTYSLILNKTGNGQVSGGGSFAAGSTVNLSATPDADSKFVGWSPSPCATSFQMPANDLTCTATFVLKEKYSLNLTKAEHGTILAEGINCGADCNESYVENTVVTLNAMPETGYKLEIWSGDCVGNSNSCQITMNGNKTVNASFSLIPSYLLDLQTSGTGLGSISGKGNYRVGETVNLTASPDANSVFVNWQPAPCNSSFQMPNQNLTCIATFNVSPPIDPVAQFTATPEMGNTPLKVTVNASASKGNIVNYQWVAVKNDKPSITFSTEGKESSFPLFTEKGIYSITLTITDNRNQTAKLTKSIRAGVSDLFFNVYRCATSSLNGFGGCEVTNEEQPFFSIGHKLKITLNSLLATNRFEPVSLWVAIQMPEGKFLFVISRPLNVDLRFHEPPNYNGEPFMANIELADRQDTILEFDVPLHFSGQYTLYALYAALGKNPLLDNSSWRSILATKSIILE